jgi:putative glutamine amidotransferase
MVNSNHHQGIRGLGQGLRINARSDDALAEAIQYRDTQSNPFFLGVQWHPERMDIHSPYSLPIAIYFLKEAKLYHLNNINAEQSR